MSVLASRLPIHSRVPGQSHGRPSRHIDLVTMAITVGVSAFGVLMIYSASRSRLARQGLSTHTYLFRQGAFLILGIGVMFVMAVIDYRRLRDWAWIAYVGICGLLLITVSPFGHNIKGAQAWVGFGSLQIQPSEVAKVVLVMVLAAFLAVPKTTLDARRVMTVFAIAGLPIGLIMLQPDLGTALVFGAIIMAMLLVAGVKARHFLLVMLLALVVVVGVLEGNVLKKYQKERLTAFIDQSVSAGKNAGQLTDAQNQLKQGKIAIGSGGLTGKGLFNGPQTNGTYVPEQHTDFIFTAVGEELGFVGAGGLLLALGVLMWRIWRIANLAGDRFGTLLCIGVLAMLMFQIFENVGMCLGIMPITGIPLPFMSYGGTALVTYLAAIGLVLNVHARRYA